MNPPPLIHLKGRGPTQAKFKREICVHNFFKKLADQRHRPETNANFRKSLTANQFTHAKMQWERAAAGKEAAFPLPAVKYDRVNV